MKSENKKVLSRKKEFFLVVLLILVTFFSRIFFVPESGFVSDRGIYLSWASKSMNSSFGETYTKTGSDNMPLILLMQREALRIHSRTDFGLSAFDFLKLPNIILDILSAVTIFYIVKRMSPRHAFLASLIYAVNPAIIFVTAYWGQADTILFALLSIAFISFPEIAMIFITTSAFYKLQSIIFLPIIIFFIIRKFSGKRVASSLLASAITALAIILPFALSDNASDITHVAFSSVGAYPYITLNAYNLWKIVDCAAGKCADIWWNSISDKTRIFSFFTLKSLSLVLFAAAYIFALFYIRIKTKKEGRGFFAEKNERISKGEINALVLSLSFVALSFFMLSTEMHERYLFYAIPLLAAGYFMLREIRQIYWVVSATFLINCMKSLAAAYQNNRLERFISSHINTIYLLPFAFSIINLIALAVLFSIMLKDEREALRKTKTERKSKVNLLKTISAYLRSVRRLRKETRKN